MSKKYIDFDEAWKEQDKTPVVVRMYGKDWELPAVLPAKVMMEVIRIQAEAGPGHELNEAQLVMMINRIVPEETFAAWMESGLSVDQYGDVIAELFQVYTGQDIRADAEGETTAPEDGAASNSV